MVDAAGDKAMARGTHATPVETVAVVVVRVTLLYDEQKVEYFGAQFLLICEQFGGDVVFVFAGLAAAAPMSSAMRKKRMAATMY